MSLTVLSVSASIQGENSASRTLAAEFLAHEEVSSSIASIVDRDVSKNDIELLNSEHVGGFYTPEAERSDAQRQLLAQSDKLVQELKEADVLVVSTPMYNFSIPAALKAWIDMICRAGETFRYTENGPEGLLDIETMYLVVATGGAPVGSPVDFVVPYMKQIASFLGIKNVEVIAADRMNVDADASLESARAQLADLANRFSKAHDVAKCA